MSKQTNPPQSAMLTGQLRWFLRHADANPLTVAEAINVHSSTLYRFLGEQRGLSDATTDKLAKYLRLRLIRDKG